MKQNSRLSLALHTLSHMAGDPDRVRTSAEIAQHAGTNPVVVRRVLGRLKVAGLLISEKGHSGGWKLAKVPTEINLADIYQALGEHLVASDNDISGNCAVEHALHKRVAGVLQDLERDLVERLAATTISDLRKP